jgi:hypothetical protein
MTLERHPARYRESRRRPAIDFDAAQPARGLARCRLTISRGVFGRSRASRRWRTWRFLGKTKGGTWNRPSRGRIDKHSTEPKYRYGWGAWPEFEEEPSVADIG